MKLISQFFTLVSFIIMFVSCGNPVKILSKEIKKAGYIQYNSPIAEAGTGTLIGGAPSNMMYIAHPQTCFPDDASTGLQLRRTDKVVLPDIAKRIETSAGANFDLIEVLGLGANSIGVGVEFDRIQTISLEFKDVTVEYMDSIALKTYYDLFMDDVCKVYLDEVGFIIQALKVGKMKFKFTDAYGADIELSAPVIEQLLNLGVDVGFSIENSYTLVIDTPMYMGFQLGQLKAGDEGIALYRAAKVKKNRYQFKSISVFDPPKSKRLATRSFKVLNVLSDIDSVQIPSGAHISNYARYRD